MKRVADSDLRHRRICRRRRQEGRPARRPDSRCPKASRVHLACHARAQNMGPKAAEMLQLIPDTPVDVIERCSGHGGTFGVVKPTHDVAVKVGRPVFRAAATAGARPYRLGLPAGGAAYRAGARDGGEGRQDARARSAEHPIQIMARAYGLMEDCTCPQAQRKITPADICRAAEYDQQRKSAEGNLIPMKKHAPDRGRALRHLLFRELRHHVAAGAGNAAHRKGRRRTDRRRTGGLQSADPARRRTDRHHDAGDRGRQPPQRACC